MKAWFFKDSIRLLAELDGIKALEEQSPWLLNHRWLLEDGMLTCDATLEIHQHIYEIRMVYPGFFPYVPIRIKPQKDQPRWSGHQYGVGGVLCLEWGPDNWLPHITGVHMLESIFRLLESENPLGNPEQPKVLVHSREPNELPQRFNHFHHKILITDQYAKFLTQLPINHRQLVQIGILSLKRDDLTDYTYIPRRTLNTDWTDDSLPTHTSCTYHISFIVMRTQIYGIALNNLKSQTDLLDFLQSNNVYPWPPSESGTLDAPTMTTGLSICDYSGNFRHYVIYPINGIPWLKELRPVYDNQTQIRLPSFVQELSTQHITLIGAGSVGSKVAQSLARAGVRHFTIVDDDTLLPGNLVRHALDWDSVGFNKADALAAALKRLARGMTVAVHKVNLTGYESSLTVSNTLESFQGSHLVIDATGDAATFTLLAAITTALEIPMVWGLVYAGGLGGMIARSRPKIDAEPNDVRQAYNTYCDENEPYAYDLVEGNNYTTHDTDGLPVIATDMDVSTLAGHLAQFALDTLQPEKVSNFNCPIYLLGFKKGWVFNGPLHNIGIEVKNSKVDKLTPNLPNFIQTKRHLKFMEDVLGINIE